MVAVIKDGKIILSWSWGGQLVLTIPQAKHFATLLLSLIGEAEKGLQVQKQL